MRAVVAIAAAVLLAAGCGGTQGPGVASVSPTASESASAAKGKKKSAVAYAKCMREHGIESFPDPGPNGEIALNATPGGELAPDNPAFQKADKACKPLLPDTGKPRDADKIRAANVKYAKCMRKHGIEDFPDPEPDGTLQVKATPGSELDPKHPAYQKADKACEHLKAGGGEGGSLQESS